MTTPVGEYYHPQPMAAGSTVKVGTRIHGFLASAAGTITVTAANGTVLVNALPLVAGYNKIPIYFGTDGLTVSPSVAGTLLT